MKLYIKTLLAAACTLMLASGCIKEVVPQSSSATVDQVSRAPGAFDNAVSAIYATLAGQFVYGGSSNSYPYDFGLTAFFLERDIMGQDIAYPYQNWWTYWYTCQYLGPSYRFSQLPWTHYYKWIKNCNEVISMAGEEPDESHVAGAGQAYAMRALFYMELAQMFAPETYTANAQAETVPLVTESTSVKDLSSNPRATNEVMWAQIISDLDHAEQYLDGYTRPNLNRPDQSVVYGLKARAYLVMGEWAKAQEYAKKAQNGYTIMTEDEYTDWDNGFNSPNGAWMLSVSFAADDPNILVNDADSSWGSWMCIEINPTVSGCGYAANYGQGFLIDRHLYETIPATDCRKKCYVDFAIDDLGSDDEKIEALAAYSKHPDWLLGVGDNFSNYEKVGGLPLKFRTAGGEAGRDNQYIGFVVDVPLMRVEEMYLIEAEAAARQNEAQGKALLEAFAKKRDASFEYGQHNEAYGNTSTPSIINEIWWQRRIEFWGEGLATYDIKRLQKGIIRSYPGTNHAEGYRWNTTTTPEWMNTCIVQTETNYNTACTNNPDPIAPSADSPEYTF